jgi:hypothetical protein
MDGLGFIPQNPRRFEAGGQVFNPGIPGPRSNLENQGNCPRVWPVIYQVRAMGLGAMPVFGLGFSNPVFNNAYAGGAPIYNMLIPGIGRSPFGG